MISAGRSGAIFESGVKGNFAKGPGGNSLEKSGQLVLVYQHLPEPAEKLTFQKIANYPRYFLTLGKSYCETQVLSGSKNPSGLIKLSDSIFPEIMY